MAQKKIAKRTVDLARSKEYAVLLILPSPHWKFSDSVNIMCKYCSYGRNIAFNHKQCKHKRN